MLRKLKNHKEGLILIAILVLATLLRFVGTTPGYHPNHSDEQTIFSTVISFIKNNNFVPYRYEYPSVSNLVNYFFYKILFIPLGWLNFIIANFTKILDGQINFPLGKDVYERVFQLEILGAQDVNPLFWSRWITALFGVGVVWASYLTGKKLFDNKVGLLTAFLVTINFRQVLNSHFGLPDIYNAFTFLLAFWSILYFREKANLSRALLCGLILGLHLATKYQFFPFIALFLVYLEKSWPKPTLKEKITFLFNHLFIAIPLVSLLVFLSLNPYLILNWEIAQAQLAYAALKYGTGAMKLLVYSYSYLFKIGIGQVTSFLIMGGILIGFLKDWWKTLLLLSIVVAYFFFFTFYTSGGFYTRNFVSVTPLLLIFAAYAIVQVGKIKPRIIFLSLAVVVFSLASIENLRNSLIIVSAYTQPWNRVVLEDWIVKNIPFGEKVAAHSSVPLPDDRYTRLPYDMYPAFSLDEFREMGAKWAITSFDWVTVEFYGWMKETNSLRYWDTPTAILDQTYPAMSVREASSYEVYDIMNPWQAPDLDFMVVKVPYYSVVNKQIRRAYDFKSGPEGWTKEGALWFGDSQLVWRDTSLVISEGGSASPILRWESGPIDISSWKGFAIDYEIKTDILGNTPRKDGYIFVATFKNQEDAIASTGRLTVRVSARNEIFNQWVVRELVGTLPKEAKYLRIGFQTYNSVGILASLRNVNVYNAEVKVDNVSGTKQAIIDDNNIFPVSHGNL